MASLRGVPLFFVPVRSWRLAMYLTRPLQGETMPLCHRRCRIRILPASPPVIKRTSTASPVHTLHFSLKTLLLIRCDLMNKAS